MNEGSDSQRSPILVTGAGGQLGQAIVASLGQEWRTVGLSHSDLDLVHGRDVTRAVATMAPRVVVNCAAFNDVDGAEEEPEEAFRVNAVGVANLARAAQTIGAQLVHYSTDFVFDGHTDRPYREEDPPRPAGVYAASKLVGEWLAAGVEGHYVLRVESLFGGTYKLRSSVDRIVEALEAGTPAPVFVDRVVSPSYVFDVAEATKYLLRNRPAPGLYHCVNTGSCTWFELGQEIARELQVEPKLRPIRVGELPLRAARPRYSALSNEKLRRAGFDMPTWQSALKRHLMNRKKAHDRSHDSARAQEG